MFASVVLFCLSCDQDLKNIFFTSVALLPHDFSFIIAVISRTLRSVPPESTDAISYPDPGEEEIRYVVQAEMENMKAGFSGGQQKNHTPDYQRVEQPDSETGINSNSSADFPGPGQAAEMKAGPAGGVGALQEGSIDAVVASAVAYEVTGSKDNWIDRNPPSVILQQHRSDEM